MNQHFLQHCVAHGSAWCADCQSPGGFCLVIACFPSMRHRQQRSTNQSVAAANMAIQAKGRGKHIFSNRLRHFGFHSNPNLRRKASDCNIGIYELEFVFLPNMHVQNIFNGVYIYIII